MKTKKQNTLGMRAAAALQFSSKYANVALNLLITSILARIISPEEFGLVAIVTVFTTFFQLFSDMGISSAIVQFRDLNSEEYRGLFLFSILLGVALSLSFGACSNLIAWLYNDDRLFGLCLASIPSLLFSTMNMVPNGIMLKKKRFAAIGVRLVASTLVSGFIAIALALKGSGCYAIVIQSDVATLIVLVWNCLQCRFGFGKTELVSAVKKVYVYSSYQFGFSFINYFSRNLDNMLVGRIIGSEALGYYDKAYKLTTYPISNISSVVSTVIQPYMAENQDSVDYIYSYWYKITKLLSLTGAIVSSVCFSAAPEIVILLYGEQWANAIPLFQALSVSVYFQMLGNPAGAFFQSLGRTDLLFQQGLMNTAFTIAGLGVGLAIGSLQAVAVCVSLAFCLQIIPTVWNLIIRGFGKNISVIKMFVPEILLALLAGTICSCVADYISLDALGALLGKAALVICVMLLGYWLSGQLRYIIVTLKK